jgi:hypothetical protein
MAATIEFGGGSITCTVRNISDSCAMLDVTNPVGIPDMFPWQYRLRANAFLAVLFGGRESGAV